MSTTTTRTDIHRPSALNPVVYEWVGEFYQGTDDEMYVAYKPEHDELEARLGTEWDEATVPAGNYATKRTCDHCGARFAYGSVYRHVPSGEIIAIGHTCAANAMLPGQDQAARKRENAARAAKATATRKANLEYRATLLFSVPRLGWAFQVASDRNDFVADVQRRFNSDRPELSEKQVLAVIRSAEKDLERAAQQAAEMETAEPVVTGKGVTIEGVVLKTKWQESDYGDTLKMLVKDDRGFRVWGSVPASLQGEYDYAAGVMVGVADTGSRVRLVANVEASDDDAYFGFFSRPRKGVLLEEGA